MEAFLKRGNGAGESLCLRSRRERQTTVNGGVRLTMLALTNLHRAGEILPLDGNRGVLE
jgi:hypothetical protein